MAVRPGGPGPFIPQHGMSQQSPAVQHFIGSNVGIRIGSGSKKKRARRVKSARAAGTARRAKARRTSSRTKGRLVKGSKAAKAYMAKIRRKRGK